MNWDEIDRLQDVTTPPPNSFNSADYAHRYRVSGSKAKADLNKLTAAGKLKKTLVKIKNAWVPYYTTVQSESCPTAQSGKKQTTRR